MAIRRLVILLQLGSKSRCGNTAPRNPVGFGGDLLLEKALAAASN
jgi:hypothetical protein